jgi:uncharacterized protein (DUF4415 family)
MDSSTPIAPSTPPSSAAPWPDIDLSPEAVNAHDEARWNGRPLAELSDAELAAAAEGTPLAEAPPDLPTLRNRERNWLKLRVTWPQKRVALSLRVDESVLSWFRRGGTGYQARMNAVLRAYVDAQIEAEGRGR